jgi:GT2 family glycosyltransferase
VILVEGGNIAQARNFGILNARGRHIAFIDSDCIAPPSWLSVMLESLGRYVNAGGVGGSGVSPVTSNSLERAIDTVYESHLGSLGSPSLSKTSVPRKVTALSTHNSIFYRHILMDVGGFDTRFLMNEDTELCLKIIERGLELYFIPESVVYHKRKTKFREFFQKFFNWGVSRTRATMTERRLFDYRIFGLLTLSLLSLLGSVKYWFVSPLSLLIYLGLISSFGIFYGVRDGNLGFFYLIPILYIVQHTGYALGLIWGGLKGKYVEPENAEYNIHVETF